MAEWKSESSADNDDLCTDCAPETPPITPHDMFPMHSKIFPKRTELQSWHRELKTDTVVGDCQPLTPPIFRHETMNPMQSGILLTTHPQIETKQSQEHNKSSPKVADGETFAKLLSDALPSSAAFRKIITDNMNQQIQVGQRTLLIHPGLPDALEVLQWEFEKVYVGKPLHMVGYLDRIGSDNYIVVDDIGNVYKAEDTILRVVGENIEKYFADGLETDEYYDYYGYLDKEKSRQCVANYDDEVEYLQISKGSAFEELPNDTDSLTGEEMEEIQQISYFADFLVDPCH